MNELLESAFRDMMVGASAETRDAAKKRAIELGRAHYNTFAEFVVRHPEIEVRHAGLRVAALIGSP